MGEGDLSCCWGSGPASPACVMAPFGGQLLWVPASSPGTRVLPCSWHSVGLEAPRPPPYRCKGPPHPPWSGSRGRPSGLGALRRALNHAVSQPCHVGGWEPWQRVGGHLKEGLF